MPALPTFTFDIGRLPFRFEPSVLRLPPLGPGSTPAVVFSPSAPRPSPHPSSKRPTSPESPGDAHRRIEVTLVRETFNIAARGHERHLATIFSRVARDAILDHLRVSGRSRVIWTRPVHTHTHCTSKGLLFAHLALVCMPASPSQGLIFYAVKMENVFM